MQRFSGDEECGSHEVWVIFFSSFDSVFALTLGGILRPSEQSEGDNRVGLN